MCCFKLEILLLEGWRGESYLGQRSKGSKIRCSRSMTRTALVESPTNLKAATLGKALAQGSGLCNYVLNLRQRAGSLGQDCLY